MPGPGSGIPERSLAHARDAARVEALRYANRLDEIAASDVTLRAITDEDREACRAGARAIRAYALRERLRKRPRKDPG